MSWDVRLGQNFFSTCRAGSGIVAVFSEVCAQRSNGWGIHNGIYVIQACSI